MVAFKLEKDPTSPPANGSGKLIPPRGYGRKGTDYPAGNGPKGSGGGHQLGPTGDTSGPGSGRIKSFGGGHPSTSTGDWKGSVRGWSDPMKR